MDSIRNAAESQSRHPTRLWPWPATGAAIGLLIALALIMLARSSDSRGEGIEVAAYLTLLFTWPCCYLAAEFASWWQLDLVLAWGLQGTLIGLVIAAVIRLSRRH